MYAQDFKLESCLFNYRGKSHRLILQNADAKLAIIYGINFWKLIIQNWNR